MTQRLGARRISSINVGHDLLAPPYRPASAPPRRRTRTHQPAITPCRHAIYLGITAPASRPPLKSAPPHLARPGPRRTYSNQTLTSSIAPAPTGIFGYEVLGFSSCHQHGPPEILTRHPSTTAPENHHVLRKIATNARTSSTQHASPAAAPPPTRSAPPPQQPAP